MSEKMCVDCKVDEATVGKRCRDCDIDFWTAQMRCEECKRAVGNELAFAILGTKHADTCSKAKSAEEAERQRHGETWRETRGREHEG